MEEIPIQGDGQGDWIKVGSRRWWIGKERERETCPGYASLLAAGATTREYRGWHNC